MVGFLEYPKIIMVYPEQHPGKAFSIDKKKP